MKLRILGILAVLVLVPAAARAQVDWPCCRALDTALMDKTLPLLQAEAASSRGLDAKLQQAAMIKSTYVANKSTLIVAKLDAADASRLNALPSNDAGRKRREANVAFYRANKARIDAALRGVNADPICGLCTPRPAGAATKR